MEQQTPALDPAGDWSVKPGGEAQRVKVLVADPFRLFRQALVRCFEDREDVLVVGAVDSPDAYRRTLRSADVDVAVVASDFLVGTRTMRELPPGDTLLADQDDASGRPAAMPSVVLVADEDLDDGCRVSGAAPPHLWEPGRPVEGSRVYIPRGAPAEMLVEAIKAVRISEPVTGASVEPESWHHARPEEQSGLWS
jgi:hypothetical protein